MKIDLYAQKILRAGELLAVEVTSVFPDTDSKTLEIITGLEKSDHISAFDFFIIQQCANKIKEELNNGLTPTLTSINISAKTLAYPEDIVGIIKDVAPYIVLEITETYITNVKDAVEFVKQVKATGAKIALDDLNHSEQGIDLIDPLQPDIIKLVFPKNVMNSRHFFRFVHSIEKTNVDALLVIENISNEIDFQLVSTNTPKAYIQGYHLDKGEVFIEGLEFNAK
jgi:EAL domain-containing protein (putative c-di-GMP-specific phosphodiesterase class I)